MHCCGTNKWKRKIIKYCDLDFIGIVYHWVYLYTPRQSSDPGSDMTAEFIKHKIDVLYLKYKLSTSDL